MAEVTEIISKDAINGIIQTDEALKRTIASLDSLLTKQKEIDTQLNKNKASFESNANAKKKTTDNAKKLSLVEQEIVKTNKQLEITQAKVIASRKENNIKLVEERENLRQINKETKQQVLINKTLSGSYTQINLALNNNIAKFKAMSKEQRENTKEGKLLANTIKQQDAELKKLDAQIGRSQRNVGNYTGAIKQSAKSLIGAFGVVGGVAAFAKILSSSLGTIKNFEKAQSELASILRTNTNGITELTNASLKYGQTTQFTASEVSGLQKELAKLGFTQSEILSSTKAVLDLAAATETDLASAAKVTGAALRAFNLDASQSNRIASVLAVATTKSALSFEDFESSLSNVAPVAQSFGFSIEETVALLGNLKDAGFDASKASVATRNILLSLADANGKLANKLGGNVTSFDELIPALIKLRESGVSLNDTLQLTDKRSVAAFNRFLEGAESAKNLRDGLIDVNDELQSMVKTRIDNLAGDVTLLSSAWDGLVLNARSGTSVFRKAVQFFTDASVKLGNLDLIFTRSSKLTQEQVSRTFDVLLAINDKSAEAFREIISRQDKISYNQISLLSESEKAFIDEVESVGYSRIEATKLWEEYLKRRTEQNEQEIKAREDALIAQQKAEEKANLSKQQKLQEENKKRAAIQKIIDAQTADAQIKAIESRTISEIQGNELIINNKLETDKIITEANQKKLDVLTEQEQAAAEQRKLINDASTQLAIDGARAIFEFQSIQSDKDIQRLENQKARELAIAGDDADKRAKIENKYAKRINAEKVKQAKRDKAAALFDIAVATATNAVKLFAQTIPPGILSAVAIAQGALQASLIASKPIPQFAIGTNNAPGTGFIAGERGRELMQLSSGSTMMVDSPTFFKGSKYRGATIKSNPETERIMSSVNDMSIINFDTMSLRKEQKRSTKQIVRAINNSNFRHDKAISQSYKERYLN